MYLFYCSQIYSIHIFRPLQREAMQRGKKVFWFFDGPGSNHLNPEDTLVSDINELVQIPFEAVFVPGNVVPPFLSGLKVQIFHGLATDEHGKKGHYKIRGFFDIYCTRNTVETATFNRLKENDDHFEVVQTGWPKIDPLFRGAISPPEPTGKRDKTSIFFASTFSPSLSKSGELFPHLSRLLETGKYHIDATLHPKTSEDIFKLYRDLSHPNYRFIEPNLDLYDYFPSADMMICDTSSIALEFALTRKPLLTYKNKSPQKWHFNFTDPDHIEEEIEFALENYPSIESDVRNFIEEIHPLTDGNSSSRILDTVDHYLGSDIIPKKKPLNLLRKLKIRRKLRYWKGLI